MKEIENLVPKASRMSVGERVSIQGISPLFTLLYSLLIDPSLSLSSTSTCIIFNQYLLLLF